MIQPPMNADQRRLKTGDLSAFICVYRRPNGLFQQPVSTTGSQNCVTQAQQLTPEGPSLLLAAAPVCFRWNVSFAVSVGPRRQRLRGVPRFCDPVVLDVMTCGTLTFASNDRIVCNRTQVRSPPLAPAEATACLIRCGNLFSLQ